MLETTRPDARVQAPGRGGGGAFMPPLQILAI